MLRHYYISDDLDDLHVIATELQSNGVSMPQIHVLSENDAEVEKHQLIAYLMGWHITAAGWLPFGFLAVILLGFCTWEGGLIGIQIPNYQFKRFQKILKQGKHIFFVDLDATQESILLEIVEQHPSLKLAGTGPATPSWVIHGQEKFNKVMKILP
jgi:hypothetical protein